MKIFLLGLPGSGKTTLGKKLAITLQLPFVDLDKEIEKREANLFARSLRRRKKTISENWNPQS